MTKANLYNTLEIPGSFLVPGFSVYVLEIRKEKEKWFYIGMTGDPYYPSARAAFHRISGHLELSNRSTQNQLQIALKENKIVTDDKDLEKLTIKMHHFPLKGFKRITDKMLNNETMKPLIKTQAYKDYQKMRQKILALENALIFELKDNLLNKIEGVALRTNQIPYPEIYKSIIGLVNNG
jgi:hypothetical protein